jgi:hypothetical protein
VQAPTYILRLPDENTARFEDRIREAEKEIGIAPENGVVILIISLNVSSYRHDIAEKLLTITHSF